MTTDYYVYVILDPRKPGNFIYKDLIFEYEPIYIGKGLGNRMYQHKIDNTIKGSKLKKIKDLNLNHIVYKLFDNLTQEDAFNKEIESISKIGRIPLNTGPLTNLTDGGDGAWQSLKGKNHYRYVEIDSDTEKNICDLYLNMDSIRTISKKLNITHNIISRTLKENNVKFRNNTIESHGKKTTEHINKIKNATLWYREKQKQESKWWIRDKDFVNEVKTLRNLNYTFDLITKKLSEKWEPIFTSKNNKLNLTKVYQAWVS